VKKYYRISNNCQLGLEYWDYFEKAKNFINYTTQFSKEYGIETIEYFAVTDKLVIAPTENDRKKFYRSFIKDDESAKAGIAAFKENSKYSKAWVQFCKDNNIVAFVKPSVLPHIKLENAKSFGNALFHIKKQLYVYIETDGDIVGIPKGFTELKASTFYKIMEDNGVEF
jgi:hypothetical protein